MAKHISEIRIDSYRGIQDLAIKDLAEINILLGDNNCGKTSVLELLSILEYPLSLKACAHVEARREDIIGGLNYRCVDSIFNVNNESRYIGYGLQLNESFLKISCKDRYYEENLKLKEIRLLDEGLYEEFREDYASLSDREKNTLLIQAKKHELEWELSKDKDKITKKERLYLFDRYREKLEEDASYSPILRTRLILPHEHKYYNKTINETLKDTENQMLLLDMLKMFDPNIININAFSEDGDIVYMISSRSNRKALPLSSYGDGMRKAVYMLSEIIQIKNGLVLIDEFETAIHTSVMDKMFQIIIESCKRQNNQLFIATHSLEALEKILHNNEEYLDDVRVITLYKSNELTVARNLDGRKALEAKDELGMELR